MKNFSWKLILVFAVIVTAVIYVLPTLEPALWPHKQINLGLDLQGGMHLVLEVDTAKAVDGQVERIMQEIRDQLREERLRGVSLDRIEGNKITATIQDAQIAEKFNALIKDAFDQLKSNQNVSGGTTNIILQLPPAEAENVEKLAVDQALETIRNRIDQFGVAEPDIRRQGQRRILIQLPGIQDPDRAKDLIGRTALLEFKLVDDTLDASAAEKGTV
ncbi:MAG: protein translocase subunit SecD, partial [Deltaproteobacteria bacterium]|nr:protein translocase subunit SecD [Deltaproteobacteria bacterium]